MPTISSHHSKQSVKALLIGDSGNGKTAAVLALAKAGYNLRILDFDNGLDILANLIKQEKNPEELSSRTHYITCTDEMKTTTGGEVIPKGQPKAFSKAMKLLNHWKEDEIDLGNISDWGTEDVLVVDSLTFMSYAVMRWHLFNVGRIGQPYQGDWRVAQEKVRGFLELLYSESIRCNVLVTAHIRYIDIAEQTQGYPESLGRALPPQIPRYFNTVVQAKIVGSGKNAKRKIRLVPDAAIGLKMAAPGAFQDTELPLETALADIFRAIRGSNPS